MNATDLANMRHIATTFATMLNHLRMDVKRSKSGSNFATAMGMSYPTFMRKVTNKSLTVDECLRLIDSISIIEQESEPAASNEISRVDQRINSLMPFYMRCHKTGPADRDVITFHLRISNIDEFLILPYVSKYIGPVENIDEWSLKAKTHSLMDSCKWLHQIMGCSHEAIYAILKYQIAIKTVAVDTKMLNVDSIDTFKKSLRKETRTRRKYSKDATPTCYAN